MWVLKVNRFFIIKDLSILDFKGGPVVWNASNS